MITKELVCCRYLITIIILITIFKADAEKQKRQLFREHVLPSKGGKIPEEAFRADRLALNQLNKEGISVPDGVVLDSRHVHKHPSPANPMPEVLRVYLTPEGRYVPSEGRYNYEHPKSVATTYLVHRPVGYETQNKFGNGYNVNKLERHREIGNPTRQNVYKPILAPLIIPTRDDLLQKTYYPTWIPEYSWDVIYEPFDDYFINSVSLFNSHQILTDYEGFLNDLHRRSVRHLPSSGFIGETIAAGTIGNSHLGDEVAVKKKELSTEERSVTSGYSGSEIIPETRFTCGQKRGVFADVESKCRIFHRCDATGKSSFLCPVGKIFSEIKKRCEWWDDVACGTHITLQGY